MVIPCIVILKVSTNVCFCWDFICKYIYKFYLYLSKHLDEWIEVSVGTSQHSKMYKGLKNPLPLSIPSNISQRKIKYSKIYA